VFFYVDESGHTGPNLFDPAQPTLFYGLLSSPLNLDLLALAELEAIRQRLGIDRLHASEVGMLGLAKVASHLEAIRRARQLQFDLYLLQKPDHAIITFFDQVFDCHMNPAVAWHHYWTPLRYVLLLKTAHIFDDQLAQKAWEARVSLDASFASAQVREVCRNLLGRLTAIPDARSREVLESAFEWAAANSEKLSYNALGGMLAKQIMPNAVGFQMVMHRIADRLRKRKEQHAKIVVDRQSQFNPAQRYLADFYGRASGNFVPMGPGMATADYRGMPNVPITVSGGAESPGLEITDALLWLYRRFLAKDTIPAELGHVLSRLMRRSQTSEVSINALAKRWGAWFEALPEPTEAQMVRGRELREVAEQRRRAALSDFQDGRSDE
jgi:hypothetical protein